MEKTIHQNIKTRLSDAQRAEAVTLYERGEMKAPEIARRFGVGRDTIYRHLKAVGAVEGRLLPELLAPLRAKLDAKIRAECIVTVRLLTRCLGLEARGEFGIVDEVIEELVPGSGRETRFA